MNLFPPVINANSDSQRWVIAITGASGTSYGRRLVQVLSESNPNIKIDLVISESALRVLREEENLRIAPHSVDLEQLIGSTSAQVTLHNNRDIGASIASGSYPAAGMVIVPCSMSTLAAVATGLAQNVVHRAADVALKEGRPLILVPRETPLSVIHLENMLTLSRAGAKLVPAMPGFYHQPQQIQELIDMMVMKIVDQMGIRIDLVNRWTL